MEAIIKALPVIEKFGLAGLVLLVMGFVVLKLISNSEKRTDEFFKVVNKFNDTVIKEGEKNRESRKEDAEKTTVALNHISDLIKHIKH